MVGISLHPATWLPHSAVWPSEGCAELCPCPLPLTLHCILSCGPWGQSLNLNLAQLQAGGDNGLMLRAGDWGAGGGFVCAVFTHAEKRVPSLETVYPDHLQELREHRPPLSQPSPDRGGQQLRSSELQVSTQGR